MVVKQRSPNYPGHDLRTAIEDIKALYQKEGRAPFHMEAGAKGLRFKSLNGSARVRLASIRQYGLMEQRKGGEARLTDRALTLLLRNPSSKEYMEALKEAALEPLIFRELYENRLTASDDSLQHHLVVNERFTDDGARKCIEAFRNTMSVANLANDGNISGQEDGYSSGNFDDYEEEEMQSNARQSKETSVYEPHPSLSREHVRVPLRLMGGRTSVAIELPETMTEAAWGQMIAMLNALKPGYVSEDSESSDLSEEEKEDSEEESHQRVRNVP